MSDFSLLQIPSPSSQEETDRHGTSNVLCRGNSEFVNEKNNSRVSIYLCRQPQVPNAWFIDKLREVKDAGKQKAYILHLRTSRKKDGT